MWGGVNIIYNINGHFQVGVNYSQGNQIRYYDLNTIRIRNDIKYSFIGPFIEFYFSRQMGFRSFIMSGYSYGRAIVEDGLVNAIWISDYDDKFLVLGKTQYFENIVFGVGAEYYPRKKGLKYRFSFPMAYNLSKADYISKFNITVDLSVGIALF